MAAGSHQPLVPLMDRDECQWKPRIYKRTHKYCINTRGNYICKCPPGLGPNPEDPRLCKVRASGKIL